MTTIELFWFLLKNLIFHTRCANKIVGITKDSYIGEIDYAMRIKNVEHAKELNLDDTCLVEGDEDYYKNIIVLG